MTTANIGYDSSFGIESGVADVYDVVAEVVSIKPPSMSRDTEDATHLKSPGAVKEFIATLKEGGDASIGLNFVPSATDALVAAFDAGAGKFQITFPNAVTLTFEGIVTEYDIAELTNSKMGATLTIKPTGVAAWA